MTWEELVFRPLTADPFIYQGTGDVDPVEEPGGGGAVGVDVGPLGPQRYDGPIARLYDEGTIFLPPELPANIDSPFYVGITRERSKETCYRPAPGKRLWIKPPLKCLDKGTFYWLKNCAGFTSIAIGTDWAVIKEAYNAGLDPTDLTMFITAKKICEACLDGYCPFDEFCKRMSLSPYRYTREALKETLKECISILARKYNSAMNRTSVRQFLPLRRIWIDEPGSENEFMCERGCERIGGFKTRFGNWKISLTDLMGSIYDAIRELREQGNPLFATTLPSGEQLQTEFVISNYDSSWLLGGTNWIQKFGGLADYIYSDDYGSTQIDEWRYPEVTDGSVISLDENYDKFVKLFEEANRQGWTTLSFFASLGFDGDPWSDSCEKWRATIRRFLKVAQFSGWLDRI